MIAVVGGGPAGCYTAYLLAKAGKKATVVEEHKKIGSPVQCAGIVTSSLNNLIKIKNKFVVNRIRHVRIIDRKNSAELKLKNENIILDRERFDMHLAEKAENEGAKILLGHKFIGNSRKKVITDKKTFAAEKIVGADGPLSGVAKINGMFGEREFWTGIQARAKLKNDGVVEFYPAVGTYAWVVPENKDTVRIGVVADKDARRIFEKFISEKIKKKDITGYQGGVIPKYSPSQITQKSNVYLVGDAACQVKATTGGGIIQAMTAAQALSYSIVEGKDYENEWRKRIGRDLWLHLQMRRIMDKFSEKEWGCLIKTFSKKKNREIIESYDRDYPSKFLLKLLLREPRLILYARHML